MRVVVFDVWDDIGGNVGGLVRRGEGTAEFLFAARCWLKGMPPARFSAIDPLVKWWTGRREFARFVAEKMNEGTETRPSPKNDGVAYVWAVSEREAKRKVLAALRKRDDWRPGHWVPEVYADASPFKPSPVIMSEQEKERRAAEIERKYQERREDERRKRAEQRAAEIEARGPLHEPEALFWDHMNIFGPSLEELECLASHPHNQNWDWGGSPPSFDLGYYVERGCTTHFTIPGYFAHKNKGGLGDLGRWRRRATYEFDSLPEEPSLRMQERREEIDDLYLYDSEEDGPQAIFPGYEPTPPQIITEWAEEWASAAAVS